MAFDTQKLDLDILGQHVRFGGVGKIALAGKVRVNLPVELEDLKINIEDLSSIIKPHISKK